MILVLLPSISGWPTDAAHAQVIPVCAEFRKPVVGVKKRPKRGARSTKASRQTVAPPLPSLPALLRRPPPPERLSKLLSVKEEEMKRNVVLGHRLTQQGAYVAATKAFSLAYAFAPDPRLLFDAAKAYHQATLNHEALILYERFRSEAPQDRLVVEARGSIGTLCGKLSDDSELVQTAQSYVDAGKKYAKNDSQRSVDGYATAYGFDKSPLHLFNIGQAYRRANRPAEAYLMFRRFLTEEPQDAQYREEQVRLRRETDNHMDALQGILLMPIYKKGRFWGTVAGSVVAVAVLTLGLSLGLRDDRETLMPVFKP